jgi:hypothetical protein
MHQRFRRVAYKLEMFIFPDDLMQYWNEKRYAFDCEDIQW